ncbi:phospholipase C [Edaphobacter acidisoli]|uniref:Phospholipase C n=1 Tax=Edaphobacter acidisoli TaxID=2040573 RepID=A0A916RDW6_9BACT|nr:alkaline phosphatase family protein [Edaphobacter acidisoli]GGA53703.1 phospholipase C [Edaphobacter acidisoli]
MQKLVARSLATLLIAGQVAAPAIVSAQAESKTTATPIKHLVVIFQENVSFDHYFGTYPVALNPPGEPRFRAAEDTPSVNGFTDALLYNNPNFLNKTLNGNAAVNPFRLDRSEAATADQDHDYGPEQQAFHGGLMDGFPKYTGTPGPPPNGQTTNGLVMGYYDGNTVTALWNYAQRFAMNDNSYGTTFGPSTPGAINLVSGQTNGVDDAVSVGDAVVSDGNGGQTLVSDADPIGDVCSSPSAVHFSGQNIGDLLNSRGVTWGFFEGGFDLATVNSNGSTGCNRSTTSAITMTKKADYIPHHQPFQYYTSTANPKHTRPSSVKSIGYDGDAGNHEYDLNDFYAAVSAGNFPSVSFLKASGYQDGHAGYSDPLDEQAFIVHVINFLQQQKEWKNTAVVIAYDDSDGWYDHQMAPIVNQSSTAQDALLGPGSCGDGTTALPGVNAAHAQGRCGYGPRLPLMVISPYAKRNFVDHTLTDQSSILRFIEDNWLGSERIAGSFDSRAGVLNNMFDFKNARIEPIVLNESTGEVIQGGWDR